MNDFKRIIPKKLNKKRPVSAKRSNSLTEENKNKKTLNTERFYTTYELFEKLNSKTKKKSKLGANSSSKKKKKSKNKNIFSLEHNKKRNNLDNIFTNNNTHYTTFETDNIKKNKKSPRKEEFSSILSKANELLSIQSDILIQCGKLNKSLAKTDLEIKAKLKNETNNNGTNVLPGLAKALYLLELKKENKTVPQNKFSDKKQNNKKSDIKEIEERIEDSFYIKNFNELNGFIGELGYSYVYNEFVNENYKKENLIIYFDNIKKLINMLHQTVNNQNEILIKQENKIQEYENIIIDLQKNVNTYNNFNNPDDINKNLNINTNSISSTKLYNSNINQDYKLNKPNSNNDILINENLSYNNMDNIKENNENMYNINSEEFEKLDECNNIFKRNIINDNKLQNDKDKKTQYYNSYISQSSFPMKNAESNYIENIKDNQLKNSYTNKEINIKYNNENPENITNKQNLPPEMSSNYLNYYNEQNILSSMINSGSFFESYKRNKEIKHNLNFNYNEKSINNE